MSALVAMMIGSPKSSLLLVKQSVETILHNMGVPIKLFIGLSNNIDKGIIKYVHDLANYLKNTRSLNTIEVIDNCGLTFAGFMNLASDTAYSQGYPWIIEAHDDVEILTPNLVPTVEKLLLCNPKKEKADRIGWISFLDVDYLNSSWAPSVREGFALDAMKEAAWSDKKTHQFHSLPNNWWKINNSREYLESLPYDIPHAPVICHAPFSHFIMINTKTLREKIGHCPDWSPLSLLVDEDRGLKAMECGLYNLWVPQIEYVHIRSGHTRARDQIAAHGPTVHKMFRDKWGFDHKCLYGDSELQTIERRYKGTNVPWSIGRRTYEWCYW